MKYSAVYLQWHQRKNVFPIAVQARAITVSYYLFIMKFRTKKVPGWSRSCETAATSAANSSRGDR